MKSIAYFSAEYSVADSLPIYAGGLGILAGDIVQEAGAEGRDFHALGLVYHEAFTPGDPDTRPMTARLEAEGFALIMDGDKLKTVSVRIGGETVAVRAWRKRFGTASLKLLDTRVASNSPSARTISDHLYDSKPGMMLRQQLVLGLAGIAWLASEGVTPDIYHLNEGHMAFAGLAVALQHQKRNPGIGLAGSLEAVKPKLVATKHTILPGAGITLEKAFLAEHLGDNLRNPETDMDAIMALGGKSDGYFSSTRFLIAISARQSGVSKIHVAEEAKAHDGSRLVATTNGVFPTRWQAPDVSADIDDDDLRARHNAHRAELVAHVAEATGQHLDPNRLTVVWARRMTSYKRPEMLVSDLARLAEVASNAKRPVQFIVAGKANPADETGMGLMNQVIAATKHADLAAYVAYLPNYNPASARLLVRGADVWLNTPVRGMEACGTSGMKASLNGAVQFSTSDGWIDEIDIKPVGWVLPETAPPATLYDMLERDIAPAYYDDHDGWTARMQANIDLVSERFTSATMLASYDAKLYDVQ